jgi:general secretion pathway protein A
VQRAHIFISGGFSLYLSHFKLTKAPFGMTPDPEFLYWTISNREALSGITYAILENKGFVILTGEAGTGKTTLLSRAIRVIPASRAVFSVVLNPTLNAEEFLESALIDFGLENLPSSKVHRLLRLQEFVTRAHSEDRTCVLVVDEAHKLSAEVLEEIRLLTNFENADRKLLQIVLAGQTELRALLNREDLRQLKQRIAVRFDLRPLSGQEVAHYMCFRWAKAGGSGELPFSDEAVGIIGSVSRGVPRVINALCDNALLLSYASGDGTVSAAHVRQAIQDLDLGRPGEHGSSSNRDAVPNLNGGPKPLAPALNLPPPAPVDSAPALNLRTLERYMPHQRKPPLLMRWLTNMERGNS